MCMHRKEVCSACRCPIQDTIVLCDMAKAKIATSTTLIGTNTKVMAYTPENVNMITSIFPHEMPTIQRNSSMCRNHYMIDSAVMGSFTYDQYRSRVDSWMKM